MCGGFSTGVNSQAFGIKEPLGLSSRQEERWSLTGGIEQRDSLGKALGGTPSKSGGKKAEVLGPVTRKKRRVQRMVWT